MQSKTIINKMLQRLDKLDNKNIKIDLDYIKDLDNNDIYFIVKAINNKKEIIEQQNIYNLSFKEITKYIKKYNASYGICRVYELKNNKLIKSSI